MEKRLRSGKLTKSHINNKGYNKYLKLTGAIHIEIDYDKYKEYASWDGLKGYLTNSKLPKQDVVENYNQLWHIERAFRVGKAELKVRPVFHRLQRRIQAHICISFCAYTVYKELERILQIKKASMSAKRAIKLTQTMYTLSITLPQSQRPYQVELPISEEQRELCRLVQL